MPAIIERTPVAYIGAKMDDGSAELVGATIQHEPAKITGDGTREHPLKAVMEVTLIEGQQYGAKVYKPGCDIAHRIAAIAKTETITPYTLMHMKAMGYTVKVQGRPEVVL
jgi:hypothetical protein